MKSIIISKGKQVLACCIVALKNDNEQVAHDWHYQFGRRLGIKFSELSWIVE